MHIFNLNDFDTFMKNWHYFLFCVKAKANIFSNSQKPNNMTLTVGKNAFKITFYAQPSSHFQVNSNGLKISMNFNNMDELKCLLFP